MGRRVATLVLLVLPMISAQARPRLAQRHVDAARGYAVSYPSGYALEDGGDADTRLFVAPLQNRSDAFQESFAVRARRAAPGATLDEVRHALQAEMKAANAELVDSDDRAKLAGRAAHRYVWSLRLGDLDLSLVQVLCVANGRAYIVTFSVERGHEGQYRRVAEVMIAAFEIT